MKLTPTLAFPLIFAISALTAALAAPTTTSTPSDPVSRLDDLRVQLERYETSIIHAYLSRASLGGSVPHETALTTDILSDFLRRQPRLQPDTAVEAWLRSNGSEFDTLIPFPPGTAYTTPVVLARDAVLDQPLIGKGIFPVGRRPQDPPTIQHFLDENFVKLPRNPSLDPSSIALLDATLLHLVSARTLLGYQVAMAKFDWQHDTFCRILTHPHPRKKILEIVVDNKQQVTVLGRVQEKAKATTRLWTKDQPYPEGTVEDVLRLFQAYLVPITTEVEVKAIEDQASRCRVHK